MMKVSVIVVSYMFEDYIEQCLISALGQKTNFDYEILVRDDFSTDKTADHIRRIAESNKRVKFFEAEKNLGPNKNFQFLYGKAKGEYVAILDGDDYWYDMELLQKSVDYLDNNNDTSMVFCGHRTKLELDNNRVIPSQLNEWFGYTKSQDDVVTTEQLLKNNYVGFGKVFRRREDLFEPWMTDLPYADWGINFRMSCYGKIKYLLFCGGIYRIHNRGIFSSEDEKTKQEILEKTRSILKLRYMKEIKKIPIILHCTENYLQNSLNLVKSLNLFHDNLKYYLYTLNFNYESDIPNLITIPVISEDIENNMSFIGNKNDVNNKNMFKSVFYKSKVVLHTITDLELDYAIYIDSDILPTGDISELFGYINQVEDYPLIQQGLFEYQINYGRGNPFHTGGFDETNILEYPLMNKHFVPVKNRTKYSVTSVMVYNKNCKQFFKEYDWMNELAFNMDIEDIKYFYPFSDETTMNVLLWKYGYNKRLPLMQMNIDEINNVKEYYESNYDYEKEITSYVRVPSKDHKNKILFFHGAKGELSNEVLDLQKSMVNLEIDYEGNKLYIYPKMNFDRDILIEIFDQNNLMYSTTTKLNHGIKYWFSTSKLFSDYQKLIIKIKDGDRLVHQFTL